MRSRRWRTLLALSAVALGVAPPVASAAFQPPVTVSGPEETATSPYVALDKDGDAVAVWLRHVPSTFRFEVVSAFAPPGGGAFGPRRVISDAGEDASSARVAVGQNGEAVAIWRVSDASGQHVEAAFRPKRAPFGPSQIVSSPTEGILGPELAVDKHGGAVAGWNQGRIEAAFRPKDGGFEVVQTLAGSGSGVLGLAMNKNGDAVAAWEQHDGSHNRIVAAFRPKGETFGPPETISAPGRSAIGPDVAIDDRGDAIAVWERFSDEGGLRAQAAFRPRGGTFGPAQTLSASGNNVFIRQPATVAMNRHGDAVAVFNAVAGTNNSVEAAMRPAGGTFGPAQPLSDPGQNSFSPEAAIDDEGDAVALWESAGGGVVRQVQAAFAPAGGSFGAAQGVSEANDEALGIEVAVDRDGNAVAVWYELFQSPSGPPRIRAAFGPG